MIKAKWHTTLHTQHPKAIWKMSKKTRFSGIILTCYIYSGLTPSKKACISNQAQPNLKKGATMLKKLVIKYVLQAIEEAIDSLVAQTPSNVDDQIWAALKLKIREYLEAKL